MALIDLPQETFYNYRVTTVDGQSQVYEYKNEKKYEEDKAAAQAAGSVLELLKSQSFITSTIEDFDDMLIAIPNKDAAVEPVKYGLGVYQTNERRKFMTGDEPEQEGVSIRLIERIQEPRERTRAPQKPQDKAASGMLGTYREMYPDAPEPSKEELQAALDQVMKAVYAARMQASSAPAA